MSMEKNYDIIRSPAITEKATLLSEANQVVFNVAGTASKPEIKKAVEELFSVKVKAVNTLNRKGKVKRFRGIRGRQSDVKEGNRHSRRWSVHRRDDWPVSEQSDRDQERWHLKPSNRTRRVSASW
jgi:large subunit ribosomal protein L23